MRDYPFVFRNTLVDMGDVLRKIIQARKEDIEDFYNLPQRFLSGRNVGKLPTSSVDVNTTDKLGDIHYEEDFVYILIDNSGTLEWRRYAIGVF